MAGDRIFTSPNEIAGELAKEGPSRRIYGVHVSDIDPINNIFSDKGIGTQIIWLQDGTAPFAKSLYGNSFENLAGTNELAYKKGGKINIV